MSTIIASAAGNRANHAARSRRWSSSIACSPALACRSGRTAPRAGSLPTRAFRYCEPSTSASGYGYYIFPPINFSLQWDGHDIMWTFEGAADWMPLKSVQFPAFATLFDTVAPPEIQEFSPPFLVALQEPGLVQLWTGIVARTAPGWSLLVRPPINVPRRGGYEPFEGIIETDRWFGPLITNIRLTKTDVPIDFNARVPAAAGAADPAPCL